MKQQYLSDEIPIDQFKGELVPFEDIQSQIQSPQNQLDIQNQEPDEIPIEQFKGETKPLTRLDLLGMAAKTGMEIVNDNQANVEKTIHNGKEEIFRQLSKKEKNGIVSDLLKVFIKSPLKGAGKAIDVFKDAALFTADAMGQSNIGTDDLGMPQYSSNIPMSRNAPELPSMEGVGGTLANTITRGMTDSEFSETGKQFHLEEIASGMDLLGQLATPGGISKLAAKYGWNGVSKIAGFLGSTDPKVLAGAFAFGTTDKAIEDDTGTLEKLGLSTGVALGTQAAVSAVAGGIKNPQKVVQMAKDFPYKAAKVGLGITKSNFNKDIAKAFVDNGFEPPVSAVTDSKIVAFANKIIGKIPYLAEFVSKRHQALEGQFKDKITSIGEKIGPVKDDATIESVSNAFSKMRELAGEGNVMNISNSLKIAENIVTQLKKAKANDDPSKAAISYLEEIISGYKGSQGSANDSLKSFLEGDLFKNMAPVQKENTLKALNVVEKEGVATVDAMIEQYQQLNGKMGDKKLFTSDNGKRTLNLLHKFRSSLNKDFEAYGAKNPAFNQARMEANELFSNMKKSEQWDAFWNKYNNNTQDTKRYKALTEALHDQKVKNELSKLLGEDMVGNLELLTKAAKGMAKSVLNDPQPSGTEIMRTIKEWISGLSTALANGTFDPTVMATTAGLGATAWALQSKNFVKKLIEFSDRPTQNKAEFLTKILQKNTGVGFAEIQKEFLKTRKTNERKNDGS